MGALVQDETGESKPIIMGSYGIGLERAMAAVVETHNDERGIIWPMSLAPYHVVITLLRQQDESVMAAGEGLYSSLTEAGYDVLFDDRDERPGVKFADAELVGVPYRVTVGPRGLESGMVELTPRQTMETVEVPLAELLDHLPAVP